MNYVQVDGGHSSFDGSSKVTYVKNSVKYFTMTTNNSINNMVYCVYIERIFVLMSFRFCTSLNIKLNKK